MKRLNPKSNKDTSRRYTLEQQDRYVEVMEQVQPAKKKGNLLKLDLVGQSNSTHMKPAKREGHLFEHFIVVGPSAVSMGPSSSSSSSSSSSTSTSSSSTSPADPADFISLASSSTSLSQSSSSSRPRSRLLTLTRSTQASAPAAPFVAAQDVRVPELVFKFPNSPLPSDQIGHFCFPHGVLTRDILASQSMSAENEIVFDSLKRIQTSPFSYVFRITAGDTVLYGVCVRRLEMLEKRPTFARKATPVVIATTPEGEQEVAAGEDTGEREGAEVEVEGTKVRSRGGQLTNKTSTLRCYCLLSRFPFFELHFSVLYSVLAAERLLQIGMSGLDDDELQQTTTTPTRVTGSGDPLSGFADDNLVIQVVKAYYGVLLNEEAAASGLAFTLPDPLQQNYTCPVGDEDTMMAEWGVPCICRAFSLTDFMFLLRALLTECSVIVVCENLGVLSCIMLSMATLLRPFVWQGVFIPILPAGLIEVIESPVPYLVGVQRLEGERLRTAGECLVVNCNTKSLLLPPVLPPFPFDAKLKRELKQVYAELAPKAGNAKADEKQTADWTLYPTRNTPADKIAVNRLLGVLRSFHQELMDSITEKIAVVGLVDFNFENEKHMADLLKLWTKEEERQFFQRLLQSQMFAMFSDMLMRALWEKESERQRNVLDQILAMLGEEDRQQAGIVSVLKIYETLNEADLEETARLEATLRQSSSRISSLADSKRKVEAELRALEARLARLGDDNGNDGDDDRRNDVGQGGEVKV